MCSLVFRYGPPVMSTFPSGRARNDFALFAGRSDIEPLLPSSTRRTVALVYPHIEARTKDGRREPEASETPHTMAIRSENAEDATMESMSE